MTQAPDRVRATVRVPGDAGEPRSWPSTAPGRPAARLSARRRPSHLGAVHVLQLLVVEAAAYAALASIRSGTARLLGVALVGLVTAALMLARWHGRWWLERAMLARRYRRRRGAGPDPYEPDPRLSVLRALAPDLTVTEVTGPDGARVGVARDGAGWYAAAQVDPPTSLRGDASARVPVDDLARALDDAGQPGAVVQVLTSTVPTPVPDPGSTLRPAFDVSYREILGSAVLPVDRCTWVVVRLDARVLAQAGVLDGSGTGGAELDTRAPAVAGALIRRLGKVLRRHGLEVQILDAPALLAAVAGACGLTGGRDTPRELWRSWSCADLAHACFWVRQWPAPEAIGGVLDHLAAPPAGCTTWVSLTLAADGDAVDLQCLTRVSGPAAILDRACAEIGQRAALAGADLFRLDGEHAPAVYASAPTGGGVR